MPYICFRNFFSKSFYYRRKSHFQDKVQEILMKDDLLERKEKRECQSNELDEIYFNCTENIAEDKERIIGESKYAFAGLCSKRVIFDHFTSFSKVPCFLNR